MTNELFLIEILKNLTFVPLSAEAYDEVNFESSLTGLRFFGLMSISLFFSDTIILLPKTSSPFSRFRALLAMSGLVNLISPDRP